MKRLRFLSILLVSAVFLVGQFAYFADQGLAASRGFSGSRGSGFGRSAPWSSPTQKTWNRSGGGLFGQERGSSGYSKPSLGQRPGAYQQPPQSSGSSSSGYSKPSLGGGAPVSPRPETGKFSYPGTGSSQTPSSSGYSKPSLGSGQPPSVSSGSGGYSKPTPAEVSRPGASTSGGYTKPSPSPEQGKFTGGSRFDRQTVNQLEKKKAQESLERYKAEQSKFQKPAYKVEGVESNPLYQKAKNYSGFDYGTYYGNRDNFYRQQNWAPPSYAFGSSPAFGLFSGMFLYWMLDHIGNKSVAATAYNHWNDPGFQKWRDEVGTLAKDNPELKSKLDEMDKQVKALQGTPKDPAYLPPGVPPEVALAGSVLATKKPEKPVLRIATGREGGWYDRFGVKLAETAQTLQVESIRTEGSLDNLRMLAEGKADMAIVQSDVLAIMDKKLQGKDLISEQSSLYLEYAQLIANRDSGIKSVQDIDPSKNVVLVGPKGSGTALTWEALGYLDKRYQKIPFQYSDYDSALSEVQKNSKALMLFVGGLNSDFLKKAESVAEKSGNLRLVTLDDRHFARRADKHGNSIYRFAEIQSDIYPSLQKGWFFSGDVRTLAVQAVVVLRTEWARKFGPEAMDALSKAILTVKPDIQKLANRTQ
ncbi:TAXI family TRAP transporter solute-binding subunit [Desulfomonile tiedjei]|uniref:TRAP transporter solute receptor, TAXI family n=1 Tax=Desulfomonile tiedjei (strain ATCC 49306 / DSM 6799 / DCB-1) TaxID=706587 RepID=I4CB55_DESTA|nr:TAXI family TRAP transporter solute-binding subunit [Desulfomonile tiedjei]AFM26796.1 TRAP transporter solute receptor, TAXI family [Desulfomonile tiedjei DSM 6799]